jgi:hypothetical protein
MRHCVRDVHHSTPRDKTREPLIPLSIDSPAVAAWRSRMGTGAKRIYEARAIVLWIVLAQNLMRAVVLRAATPAMAT